MQFIKVQSLNLFENYFTAKNLKYKWTISAENTIKNFLSPQRILCQIILLEKKSKYKWTIIAENTIKNFLSPQRILCQQISITKP